MGKIEEIISKYASSPGSLEEFGPWLVSEKNAAEKEEALASLWSSLESCLPADDAVARKAKLGAIMAGLEGGYSPGKHRVRGILRWSLATAAAIVAIALLSNRTREIKPLPEAGQEALLSGRMAEEVPLPIPSQEKPYTGRKGRLAVSQGPQQTSLPAVASLPENRNTDTTATDIISAQSIDHSQKKPIQGTGEDGIMSETTDDSRKKSVSFSFYGSSNIASSHYATSFGTGHFNAGLASEQTAVFDAPLSFGLSVRFPLTGKLSFESGLTYSYLHSTYSDLHYAGIPFYLSYNIYSGGNIGFYTSAGGSVLYCIHGGGQEHPLQAAATISCGLEYMLSPKWSIFGEGSMNHYFKDGSPLITYYSENPFAFSAKAGIRFTLYR